jgi:hypothetical protein
MTLPLSDTKKKEFEYIKLWPAALLGPFVFHYKTSELNPGKIHRVYLTVTAHNRIIVYYA